MAKRSTALLLVSLIAALGAIAPRAPIAHADHPRVRAAQRSHTLRVRLDTTGLGSELVEVIARDLALVPELEVVDDRPDVVVRGTVKRNQRDLGIDVVLESSTGTSRRSFLGRPRDARGFLHSVSNDLVSRATGRRSAFGSRIAFARRSQEGRKAVFVVGADGQGLERVSSGNEVAVLPDFGVGGGIWYTVITRSRMFITREGHSEAPVIDGRGLDMGVHVCGDRVLFSSTRDGNAEIYSADRDGGDVHRLTHEDGIDVSPSCAADGRIAFVSDRSGSPQIYVMHGDGSHERQVTHAATQSQTPAFCPSGDGGDLIAYTSVGGSMRVKLLNLATGRETTLARGSKDPAFSPDCRFLAYATDDGVRVRSLRTRTSTLLIRGHAESVRWGW